MAVRSSNHRRSWLITSRRHKPGFGGIEWDFRWCRARCRVDFGALRGAALRAASRVHTRLKGVPVRVLARLWFCIATWSRLHARAAHAQTAPMSTPTTNLPKHCALAAFVSVQARSQTHPTADARAVAIIVAMAARFVRRRDTQEATADNISTHDTTNDGRAADAATSSAASNELCGDGKRRLRLCRSSCAKRSKRTRPSQ